MWSLGDFEGRMKMKKEDFDFILNEGEGQYVEFKESFSPVISKEIVAFFKDRIEIYNPGEFPEGHSPREYILGKGESILRNPLLANTLFLSKDIEKWGSGLKRIYELCKEAKVRVEFEKVKTGFKVIFYRKNISEEGLVEELEESQREIIKFISENSKISKQDLSKKIGISTTAIDKNILRLKEKGLIERVGGAKGGHWKINPRLGSMNSGSKAPNGVHETRSKAPDGVYETRSKNEK